ncbi:MAG: molybdenum cofactor biosynthesis protein B [Polyangiaceae bacterium]
MHSHEDREFSPLSLAVVTVSDTRTLETDRSGNVLELRMQAAGHRVTARRIVRDDQNAIVAELEALLSRGDVDVIVTTGGTGVTGRDVTPEALERVCEKLIPGFGELFRWLSYATIGTSTIQSRATAGTARGKYIFALPGSTSACEEAWDKILVFQLDVRHRPCNFAELIPRLTEK